MIIKRVSNGWLIKEGKEIHVFTENESNDYLEGDVSSFAEVLYYINSSMGPSTSRYSAKRIYIEIRPGDKHDDYKETD